MTPEQREIHDALVRGFVDRGKLIEAGWLSMRLTVLSPNVPAVQLDYMRMAFMAGAQHLFSSIMAMLESGTEPTATDERRMSLISDELEAFRDEIKLRIATTGRAQ